MEKAGLLGSGHVGLCLLQLCGSPWGHLQLTDSLPSVVCVTLASESASLEFLQHMSLRHGLLSGDAELETEQPPALGCPQPGGLGALASPHSDLHQELLQGQSILPSLAGEPRANTCPSRHCLLQVSP